MKAVIVRVPGGPEQLEVADLPDLPAPGPQEALLDVFTTALNRADLLQRRGLYPPPPGATPLLGLECAGVIRSIGSAVTGLQPGDRVMALLPGGGYAEQVTIPGRMAIPIPDGMSFEEAASLPEAFMTAREALFSLGRLGARETVLVHAAASGVGSAALQLARVHGSSIFATAGTPEKLSLAKELGAEWTINYKLQDFVGVIREATAAQGVDVILDFVGAAYADKHAECLANGGRHVVIGLLGGASAKLDFSRLLRARHSILGLVMRTRSLPEKIAFTQAFIRETLPLFVDGRLRPVIDRVFSVGEVRTAHERMESNANIGKIVLKIR